MDCVIEATMEEYVNGWVHERLCAGWKTSACAGHEVVRGAVLRGRPAGLLPARTPEGPFVHNNGPPLPACDCRAGLSHRKHTWNLAEVCTVFISPLWYSWCI